MGAGDVKLMAGMGAWVGASRRGTHSACPSWSEQSWPSAWPRIDETRSSLPELLADRDGMVDDQGPATTGCHRRRTQPHDAAICPTAFPSASVPSCTSCMPDSSKNVLLAVA